jgi:hypothetical protein
VEAVAAASLPLALKIIGFRIAITALDQTELNYYRPAHYQAVTPMAAEIRVAVLCAYVALIACCASARPPPNAGMSSNATVPGSASVQDHYALLLDSRFREAVSPSVIAWSWRTANDTSPHDTG